MGDAARSVSRAVGALLGSVVVLAFGALAVSVALLGWVVCKARGKDSDDLVL